MPESRQASSNAHYQSARENLTEYKRVMYRRYQHAPHLEKLDKALMQVTRYIETGGKEGIGRLIVEMPPRHGKTMTVSQYYPTWHLGNRPNDRVMLVSYGATLAQRNSRAARNLIRSPLYRDVFGVELARDSAAADRWNLQDFEGGCDALGIDGGATGKGAHLLIVDDPVKSRKEAESETMRNNVYGAFTVDLYSRAEPGGACVVMMTRWHQDDLIGRLLRHEPDKWTRLRLPAIAEDNDPLGREPGAALWPLRYPVETLADIQRTMSDYSWSALYQQRPTMSEGHIFKRSGFNIIPDLPESLTDPYTTRYVRFWDLAMSERETADYTATVKMTQALDGRWKVLDVQRRQLEWTEVVDWVAEVAIADGPDVIVGVEQVAYMSRAVQQLLTDPRLLQHTILGYKPDRDKVTRALPFAARVGNGLVDVVEGAYTYDFIDELCAFDKGAHDDMVDAASGAYNMLDETEGGAEWGQSPLDAMGYDHTGW